MAETDDAAIGKLIREKRDLDQSVYSQRAELASMGDTFTSIGTALLRNPEKLTFTGRPTDLQFLGAQVPAVNPTEARIETVIERVEAYRANLVALREVTRKLESLGFVR